MDPVIPFTNTLKFYYGIGHVLNDITASLWFSYLLVFFHLVLKFDSTRAGILMLVGQVADALSTPFVGYFSDKNDDFFLCRRGKRRAWYFVGTVCVLFSFPFIFTPCLGCATSSLDAQLVYYCAFVVLFQFGWAAVQVSHLALIPELTSDEHRRTQLTSLRSSFSVLSNILVYFLTYFFLRFGTDTDPSNQVGPKDKDNFALVAFVGIIIGGLTSLIFHAGIQEASVGERLNSLRIRAHKSAAGFLKDPKLYQVAVLYTCSRLFMNLSQVYMPLYLHETLRESAQSLALIPLAMYISSLFGTYLVNHLNKHLGRMISYIVGALIGLSACLWIFFGSGTFYRVYGIYIVASLIGFGGNIMLVTTLGVTADLIGPDYDSSAFVYGSMSFADKLANGAAVMIIQRLVCDAGCQTDYRNVMSYVCGGFAVFGLIPLFSLRFLSQRNVPATIEPRIEDPVVVSASSDGTEPLIE